MHGKLNIALKIEDDNGNTANMTTVDVYINTLNEKDFDAFKSGLIAVYECMNKIIRKV